MKQTAPALMIGLALGLGLAFVIWPRFHDEQNDSRQVRDRSKDVRASQSFRSASRDSSRLRSRRQACEGLDEIVRSLVELNEDPLGEHHHLRVTRITLAILRMDAEEVTIILQNLAEITDNEKHWTSPLSQIAKVAIARLFELDGHHAIDMLANDEALKELSQKDDYDEWITSGLTQWVRSDPESARSWLEDSLTRLRNNDDSGSTRFLDDGGENLSALMLAYEQIRPGMSSELVEALGEGGPLDEIALASFNARIQLAKMSDVIFEVLQEAKSLPRLSYYNLLHEALEHDAQGVADRFAQQASSPQRDRHLIHAAQALLNQSEGDSREQLAWLSEQKLTHRDARIQRLKLMQRRLHDDFINGYGEIVQFEGSDFITPIPGIAVRGSGITEPIKISRNSIDVILNNPMRTGIDDPESFVQDLRSSVADQPDGPLARLIENEIRELELESED